MRLSPEGIEPCHLAQREGRGPTFLTRAAGAQVASIVTGAPVALFLHVDDAYDKFLALCEESKRPVRPLEDSMKIGASEFSGETPPAGVHNGVCLGFKDLGMRTDKFGTSHKVQAMFELAKRDSKNKRFRVARTYNAVWGTPEKPSNLRKDIESWLSRDLTSAEIKAEIDMDQFVGKNAQLVLKHKLMTDGKTFANITNVLPSPDGDTLKPEGTLEAGTGNGNDYAARAQAEAQENLRRIARESEPVEGEEAL